MKHWSRLGTYIAISSIAFGLGFIVMTAQAISVEQAASFLLLISLLFTIDGTKWW